jgi:hypothetical protein
MRAELSRLEESVTRHRNEAATATAALAAREASIARVQEVREFSRARVFYHSISSVWPSLSLSSLPLTMRRH